MNNFIKIYFFLILIIAFTSCGKEKPLENTSSNKALVEESFAEKVKSKPKIFLKYWEGMSSSEFYEVTAMLKKRIFKNKRIKRFKN